MIEQLPGPEYAGLMLHEMLVPVGSASESVTLVAVPVPAAELLLTVIVKPMLLPALTVAASAVFVIERLGHWTVVEALAVTWAWLVAWADAVLLYVLQLALVVELVTWMLTLPFWARSPRLQESVLLVIEHPVTAGLMLHEIPVPVGSASETDTDLAVPTPLLLTVIVKPIELPASTVAASAVLVMSRSGQFTTTCAVACAEPSFVVVTLAVFEIVAQLAKVVAEVRWTFLLAPAASVPKLHVRTPLEIEHPVSELAASMLHDSPLVVGRLSVTVTPVAEPAPSFFAVIVNPIVSPAFTGEASAVFVSLMSPQLTVTVAVAGGGTVPPVPVEKLTVAVLV